MSPAVRKFALTGHVVSSLGLLGSIAAFLVLAVTAISVDQPIVVRGAYPAMDVIARLVVVPLALAALVTGVIQALGTSWGLFRHYWVVVKLVLTSLATVILLMKMGLIAEAAQLAQSPQAPLSRLSPLGLQLVVHSGGGLLVLMVPTVLSIYKPRGMTPYGFRKQQGGCRSAAS